MEQRDDVSRLGLDVKQACFASAVTRSAEFSNDSLLKKTLGLCD